MFGTSKFSLVFHPAVCCLPAVALPQLHQLGTTSMTKEVCCWLKIHRHTQHAMFYFFKNPGLLHPLIIFPTSDTFCFLNLFLLLLLYSHVVTMEYSFRKPDIFFCFVFQLQVTFVIMFFMLFLVIF